MVFRKPYAFLIKNFKKIHILLLILCSYIYYKITNLRGFINEFIKYLSYDKYLEPITKHTNIFSYFILLVIVIIILTIIVLLKRKNKPWKLYLFPLIGYILTLFVFIWAHSYFSTYSGEIITKTAITMNGFLFVATIPQYITFVILIIRIIGIDLNRFGFKNDEEYIEMDEDDKAEFEVNVEVDKHAFKRTYRKAIRSLNYFYEEHKWLLNVFFVVIILIFVFLSFRYFLSHKTINENNTLNANGYSIKINKSYYTDKNQKGEILEKNSSFVVLNITVRNNAAKRKLETSNFHLVNGKENITFSESTYVNSFIDIGKKYTKREFRSGEERNFAMIFKVDKNLDRNKFVLYYQEYKSSSNVYLRKIKLNLVDLTEINTNAEKSLGDKMIVQYPDKTTKSFMFEKAIFTDKITYNTESCNEDFDCSIEEREDVSSSNEKILKIDFSSPDFEGEELIDFSINYGKIIYRDKDGITREVDIENKLKNTEYLGKFLYIKVPSDIESSDNITIVYTVRNQKYRYKIR